MAGWEASLKQETEGRQAQRPETGPGLGFHASKGAVSSARWWQGGPAAPTPPAVHGADAETSAIHREGPEGQQTARRLCDLEAENASYPQRGSHGRSALEKATRDKSRTRTESAQELDLPQRSALAPRTCHPSPRPPPLPRGPRDCAGCVGLSGGQVCRLRLTRKSGGQGSSAVERLGPSCREPSVLSPRPPPLIVLPAPCPV